MAKIKAFLYKHRFIFALLGIIFMYGVVGAMDYHDERMMECAQHNKDYDSDKDVCYVRR